MVDLFAWLKGTQGSLQVLYSKYRELPSTCGRLHEGDLSFLFHRTFQVTADLLWREREKSVFSFQRPSLHCTVHTQIDRGSQQPATLSKKTYESVRSSTTNFTLPLSVFALLSDEQPSGETARKVHVCVQGVLTGILSLKFFTLLCEVEIMICPPLF